LSELTVEEFEELKYAPAIAGIPEWILKRWSPRAFEEREVAAGDLEKLFLAASWAASCFNEQPWRFFAGRRGDETYKKILDVLVEGNRAWAQRAPVLALSMACKNFAHDGSPNGWAVHDTGAATAYLTLTAAALGLHAHAMAGFDKEAARASFGVPADYEMVAAIAVGYQGDPSTLPEALRKMETSPRSRKPLSAFVFSEWEKPAEF
jgi:nitroreductase